MTSIIFFLLLVSFKKKCIVWRRQKESNQGKDDFCHKDHSTDHVFVMCPMRYAWMIMIMYV